ncbi:hypothetical protein KR018_012601, partial [Drosophila ironensis]
QNWNCIWHGLILSLMTLHQPNLATGSRILAAFLFPAKSHFMMTNALIRELVARGHEVTNISPVSLANENLGPNYKEVLFAPFDSWKDIRQSTNIDSVMDMTDLSMVDFLQMVYAMGLHSTDFAFEQPELQAIINAKNKIGQYDLLLTEQFYNDGVLILAHIFQIPVVTISTSGFANFFSQIVGIVSPWAYVPHKWMPYSDHMNLWERLGNVIVSGSDDLYRELVYYPRQDAILRKHFSRLLDRVPTIKELQLNISAILLNTYPPLVSPRPTSFNMIQVGGLHIQPAKALPEDLQEFLDGATHGAIYFSLGSQVRSTELSPQKLEIFLNVFRSLKQRILWKFEDNSLPNLPANVKVEKWLPQRDILAHPNVKLFIAHGGLFGLQEAVYNGVPVLGMPVYGDQYLNLNQAKAIGCGLVLDYRKFSENELRSSMRELLENPKYGSEMKKASHIFRDRPLGAMDTAVYWIEYVIAHQGASHLVAAGVELPWYQFYLLDIVALILGSVLAICGLFLFILRKLRENVAKKCKTRKV